MAQPIIPVREPAAACATTEHPRVPPTPRWVEVLMRCAVAAVAYGIMRAAAEWHAPLSPNGRVRLSASALPSYAGLSTLRMWIASVLSLVFSVVYARIAAGSRTAQRFVLPLLDILQRVPILSCAPGVLLALLALPGGVNIAAVALMLFGTQWYVLFNVIAGAMAIPSELLEVAATYRVSGWRRWKTLILPAISPYLVTGMTRRRS